MEIDIWDGSSALILHSGKDQAPEDRVMSSRKGCGAATMGLVLKHAPQSSMQQSGSDLYHVKVRKRDPHLRDTQRRNSAINEISLACNIWKAKW